MNTIVWAIVMFNAFYGTQSYFDQVRYANKAACEEALAVVMDMRKRKDVKVQHQFHCMQVVMPAIQR